MVYAVLPWPKSRAPAGVEHARARACVLIRMLFERSYELLCISTAFVSQRRREAGPAAVAVNVSLKREKAAPQRVS